MSIGFCAALRKMYDFFLNGNLFCVLPKKHVAFLDCLHKANMSDLCEACQYSIAALKRDITRLNVPCFYAKSPVCGGGFRGFYTVRHIRCSCGKMPSSGKNTGRAAASPDTKQALNEFVTVFYLFVFSCRRFQSR